MQGRKRSICARLGVNAALLAVALIGVGGCWISPSADRVDLSPEKAYDAPRDTIPPKVELISPRDGDVVSGTVKLEARAVDESGIFFVNFYVDDATTSYAADFYSPYEYFWKTDSLSGESVHAVYAKAWDRKGNSAKSPVKYVVVSNGDSSGGGAALNEDISYLEIFPPDNWWHLDISQAPVDPRSDAFIDWIGRDRSLHPDFGPPPYGIPYAVVPGSQPLVPVHFYGYPNESDYGAPGRPEGYPLPDEAKRVAGFIEGAVPGGGDSGDRHMLVVDRDNRFLFETFGTRWNEELRRWEASCGAVFDLSSNQRRPEGWTSADAAGLAVLPGLVRYDEVYGQGEIDHALRFTLRASNGYVWPASHEAGREQGAPPMGMRLRLKSTIDISGYPEPARKIFRAMRKYGLILADNGSDMYVQGTMDARWDSELLNQAFRSIRAGDFEVISLGYGREPSAITGDRR